MIKTTRITCSLLTLGLLIVREISTINVPLWLALLPLALFFVGYACAVIGSYVVLGIIMETLMDRLGDLIRKRDKTDQDYFDLDAINRVMPELVETVIDMIKDERSETNLQNR